MANLTTTTITGDLTLTGTATGDFGGGGTSWDATVKTANFTAVSGEGYFINTSGGGFTATLPSSPSVGDEIAFVDWGASFSANNLLLNPGANKIESSTGSAQCGSSKDGFIIVYSGSTRGWVTKASRSPTPYFYPVDVEYLALAGGGGGGGQVGGGGGAGGFLTGTYSNLLGGQVLNVTIGGGGNGSPAGSGPSGQGGSTTISGNGLSTVTCVGGGGGGSYSGDRQGKSGGSGGGGGDRSQPGGSGTSGQGFAGGASSSSQWGGGGGGGAGAVGNVGNPTGSGTGGDGGIGKTSSITGTSTYYGGGGAGCTDSTSQAIGGLGGGGNGGVTPGGNPPSTAGGANTGGGSGGERAITGAKAGGSGVVFLKMLTSLYSGNYSGSPTITTTGSYTVLKFTGAGSYTC